MRASDIRKVVLLLVLALAVVALYCYARVDLSLSLADLQARLASWSANAWVITLTVWSQLAIAGLAGLGYRARRHRLETTAVSR